MQNFYNMNSNLDLSQTNSLSQTKRKREKHPPRKLQPKDYYVKLHDPVQHARALTDKTKILYCAIKHWLKNMPYCTPNYEMLGDWAGIKSKATISKHRKVLLKVGLIRYKRRGFKQSNRYEVPELTDAILKKLYIPHKRILDWIAEEDEQVRQKRQVKRDLRAMKQKRMYMQTGYYKKAPVQSYPQIDEVQFMNSYVLPSLREANTISSIRSDAKFKIEEKRGKPVKIAAFLPSKAENKALLAYMVNKITPVSVAQSWASSRPPSENYMPFGSEKLIGVTTEVALKLGNMKNLRSNIGHTNNIFKLIKLRKQSEDDLICMMYTALSLTQKHEGTFKTCAMAYFYSIVEYAYGIKTRKHPP